MSVTGPELALCHLSSSFCKRARSTSSSPFSGARSCTSESKSAQKTSGVSPVPGSTSSSTKRFRLAATLRFWQLTNSVIGALHHEYYVRLELVGVLARDCKLPVMKVCLTQPYREQAHSY